jgi:hypothetical protein
VFAAFFAVTTAVVAVCGISVDPDALFRWLFLAGFVPLAWAYVGSAQVRGDDEEVAAAIMDFHRYTFAFAGFMLTSRAGLRLMVLEGLLDPSWLATGQRFSGVVLGVGMILFGNFLPALRSPWRLQEQPFAWQHVHRFVGWTFVLAGLGVLACWLLLPLDSAVRTTAVMLVIACSAAVVRKFASVGTWSFRLR